MPEGQSPGLVPNARVSGTVPETRPGRSLREGTFTGQRAADDQLLDLARPFVQRRHARAAEVLPHRVLVAVALPSASPHRFVRRAYAAFARVQLSHRRLE